MRQTPIAQALSRVALREALQRIEEHDTDYPTRYELVWAAASLAIACGFRAGVAVDPTEPQWPVIYIELPGVGQVSWHVPAHGTAWDGHTTPEKYDRIRRFIDATSQSQGSTAAAAPATTVRPMPEADRG